jgi:hypothetical protein
VSQFHQLYQPTFNAPVSPQEDLKQFQQQGPGISSSATTSSAVNMKPAAPAWSGTSR